MLEAKSKSVMLEAVSTSDQSFDQEATSLYNTTQFHMNLSKNPQFAEKVKPFQHVQDQNGVDTEPILPEFCKEVVALIVASQVVSKKLID